MSKYNKDYYII